MTEMYLTVNMDGVVSLWDKPTEAEGETAMLLSLTPEQTEAIKRAARRATPKEYMVYGMVHVIARNKREATDKALAGDTLGVWEVIDDVDGTYCPEVV